MKTLLVTIELPDYAHLTLKSAAARSGLTLPEQVSLIATKAIMREVAPMALEASYPVDPTASHNTTHTAYTDHTTDSVTGDCLTKDAGVFNGPSGKETWYDLPMDHIVERMRGMGFDEGNYPYWIREDGCKMLGPYIMVAANLGVRPRGTTVETSLGTGLVCDTGGFAYYNAYQVDIATNWSER